MSIADEVMVDSPLVGLIGNYKSSHVGYIYSMNFTDAYILTNDAWKERVSGIPHNSFLVASAFDPEKMSQSSELDKEVVLLRVIGPAPLPSDADLIKTRVEHNQRRTEEEIFSSEPHDGLDPLTQAELQYGAIKCRILGTFYVQKDSLRLGSDLENYMSSTRLRVFKPIGEVLEKIVNHINPEVRDKALDEAKKSGFNSLPTPIKIGTIRFTSSSRLHRRKVGDLVPVTIQPTDFLARRTAVLGMTRTGKSNTVKTTVSAVTMTSIKDGVKVGQVIFDVNGEYANANGQDDGSSIAEVFKDETIRYRSLATKGFFDIRNNFYKALVEGLEILQTQLTNDGLNKGQDLQTLISLSLDNPDQDKFENQQDYIAANKRLQKISAIYKSLLKKSGFQPSSEDNKVIFAVGEDALSEFFKVHYENDTEVSVLYTNKEARANYVKEQFGDSAKGMSLDQAVEFFTAFREANQKRPILVNKKPWLSDQERGLLNLLVGQSDNGTFIRSTRVIANAGLPFHSTTGSENIPKDIYEYLLQGKIVIVDLSVGVESVRKTASERIASYILSKNMDAFSSGRVAPKIVIYVEEAHNLIGKDADFDTTWPRIAKEGAKAGIALVYSTQEPSSVHPNILANTENWFVTHLNNEDELRSLGKFYDFKDFHDSLKTAQDVGFARIKTLSSPFVIPTQIDRFTPELIKQELLKLKSQ